MRLHEGHGPGFRRLQERAVGAFQLHGRAAVHIDGHGTGSLIGGAVPGVEHGFGEGEDDAGQGQQPHQEDEPMADAVAGAAFLSDFPKEGGLRELDLAVPAEAEQVDQHRKGQRGKRPEDLGVDELHRSANLAPILAHARTPFLWYECGLSPPPLRRPPRGVEGVARRGGRPV